MKMHSIRYLEKEFDVTSICYKKLINGRLHNCRHVTKIIRKGTMNGKVSEALIILAYPKHNRELENSDLYEVNPVTFNELCLKKTTIDIDASGVMHLMNLMNWNITHVMYLTDLVYYNEARFRHDLFFMEKNKVVCHKAISQLHEKEWASSLLDGNIPIIAAWGTKRALCSIAKKALVTLQSYGEVYGVKQTQNNSNYHSFIKGNRINERIIVDIAEQLKANR